MAGQDGIRTIVGYKHDGCSVNGNPRFLVSFTDGTIARTMSDASIGYEIGNAGMRQGSTVYVEFTRAGRIRNMSRVQS